MRLGAMKQKCLCCSLLFLLLFSSSCQKKEDQITFDVRFELGYGDSWKEKALIQESGVVITLDWEDFKLGKATQEQFDFLKQKQVPIYRKWEWIPVKKENDEPSDKKEEKVFVKDPYQDHWNLKNKKLDYRWSLVRFYKDLNQDGVPEVLFPRFGGSGGTTFSIFQIIKTGYLYLGSISYSMCQTLPTKHNGFNDLMLYWHFSADDGSLSIEEFNGSVYETVKEMYVIYELALNEKIIVPDDHGTWESHPESDKLLWSTKDDDKYRRMIK